MHYSQPGWIAEALAVPVIYFFNGSHMPPIVSGSDTQYVLSEDEKTLLKYFKRVTGKSDRQFVISAARLASKKYP